MVNPLLYTAIALLLLIPPPSHAIEPDSVEKSFTQLLCNYKIAEQLLEQVNNFNLGVSKDLTHSQAVLNNSMNNSIETVKPVRGDVITIKSTPSKDYDSIIKISILFMGFLLIILLWNNQLRRLNRALASRERELIEVSSRLNREVSAIKEADEKLTSSLSMLNATLESTADGILVTDLGGHISRWNQKFADLWNIPDDLLKTDVKFPLTQHIKGQMTNPEAFYDKVVHLYNNPEISSFDILILLDGRYFKRFSQPQRVGDSVVGRVWSFSDITEQKLAEKALEDSNRMLAVLSSTDVLTGIANRRCFNETLAQEYARHSRSGAELSLIMLDIDHFKAFNDTYGHLAGDECLKKIGRVLADSASRASDLSARYGGEEFVCILPETASVGAIAIAEKIRGSLRELAIPHKGSSVAEIVTASMGVVTVTCCVGGAPMDIVSLADDLLYRAKTRGRDRLESLPYTTEIAAKKWGKTTLVQLSWSEEYSCGVEKIDIQHKSLFESSNILLKMILSGMPASDISPVIDQLLDDICVHFRDEESILESASYPVLANHSLLHSTLLAEGKKMAQAFKESSLTTGDVFEFLVHNVVIQHMLGADKEFFPFLRGRNII
ncbi:MAG: diguanylate cyclase [Desulfuromonadaceae bacterium]|nr:diguanylate cyclase [Desulfuromonadaceae bacterium]MDD2856830.1 diguanylate cyclase [Desulfuromonadaceae bacterium]